MSIINSYLDHSIADLITRTKGLNAIYDLIAALNNITAGDVWTYSIRTLTSPSFGDIVTKNLTAILSDSTAFKGADITSILALLTDSDESGSFTWDTSVYSTNETDISALFTTPLTGTTRRKYAIYLDLTGPAGDAAAWTSCTVRVKIKIDGSNYRTVDKKALAKTDVASSAEPGVPIDIPPVAQDVQITLQFDVALNSNQTIYYHYVKGVME